APEVEPAAWQRTMVDRYMTPGESRLLSRINAYRVARGSAPLIPLIRLNYAAYKHSAYLSMYGVLHDHCGYAGSAAINRVLDAGVIPASSVGVHEMVSGTGNDQAVWFDYTQTSWQSQAHMHM